MIAVTGATGLLGNIIVQQLAEQGVPVIGLTHNLRPSATQTTNAKIIWRKADITDPVSLHEALHDAEGVIHAAAMVSFNPRHRKELHHINVAGTRNIVNACLNLNLKRLVYISSVAALGRQKKQTLITEDNIWVETSTHTCYAATKYRGELEVFRGQEEGLSTAILNPSVILAPGNWNRSSAQLFKYVWKEIPFYIEGSLNYVDGRDAAALAIRLYNADVQGERFIANAGAVPYKRFFDEAAARLNRKTARLKVSGSWLHLLSSLEQARAWLGGNPLITRETALLAGQHFVYDNQKVTQRFAFSFQSFENTLDWCCSAYLQQVKNQNNR